MSEFEDVHAFHVRFGLIANRRPVHLSRRKLAERANFMLEELVEFAMTAGLTAVIDNDDALSFVPDENADQDLAGQADALIDLVYVALGTAVQLGLPWVQLWDDVHAANMRKERGMTSRGHAVDVTKPPGWAGPRTAEVLADAGYARRHWVGSEGRVVEGACVDDAT